MYIFRPENEVPREYRTLSELFYFEKIKKPKIGSVYAFFNRKKCFVYKNKKKKFLIEKNIE